MRAIFGGLGLIGLLVVVAIMLKMWADDAAATGKAKKSAEEQLVPMTVDPGVVSPGSGVGSASGVHPIRLSYTRAGLRVDDIGPGDTMYAHYGLQKGDLITQAAGSSRRDWDDEAMARWYLDLAYKHQGELRVERGAPPQEVRLDFKK